MHRTQIYLADYQYEYLKRIASEYGISIAEVIRTLIDNQLPKDEDYEENPLFSIWKKKFTMKRKDGSTNHDTYIYQQQK